MRTCDRFPVKSEARVDFRIDGANRKNIRMDMPEPPSSINRLFTNATAFTAALETTEIKFRAGFSKGKYEESTGDGYRTTFRPTLRQFPLLNPARNLISVVSSAGGKGCRICNNPVGSK